MRLTDKILMPIITDENNCAYLEQIGISHQRFVNKLGQLEDIEDELGIDLITLFKALKNGFYGTMYGVSKEDALKHNREPIFYELKDVDIKKYNGKIAFIHYLGHMSYSDFIVYKFADYGKTWALDKNDLTKEELK